MNKSSIQKKFRFVMIIAAIALFITIFLPAYIRFGSTESGNPRVCMMWTVLFGTGGGAKLNNAFEFSWIAFIGYALVLILLIISLIRKYISVEGSEEKMNSIADAACFICSLLSLVMFILLPLTITKTSTIGNGTYLVNNYYTLGVAYIIAFIILGVMLISSFVVLYAETILKFKKVRDKKQIEEKKDNTNE